MTTANLSRLLFLIHGFIVFCFLLTFYMGVSAGNGGEYWGKSKYREPFRAAGEAFDEGDYYFLRLDLVDSLGQRHREFPGAPACREHPYGPGVHTKANRFDSLHGLDSIVVARRYALAYNRSLAWNLLSEGLGVCVVDQW